MTRRRLAAIIAAATAASGCANGFDLAEALGARGEEESPAIPTAPAAPSAENEGDIPLFPSPTTAAQSVELPPIAESVAPPAPPPAPATSYPEPPPPAVQPIATTQPAQERETARPPLLRGDDDANGG
ncbi:MAG: hypothetical protein MI723_07075 [Caulobacterales bacterium]|nr:hypothetical protein [Caulobacterales bacterium]